MFDDIKWKAFINNILSYIKSNWKCVIIKADISRTSYSTKFYYSKNNNKFIDLYNVIDQKQVSVINNEAISEFKKITAKFNDYKEKMFLTIRVEKTGDVKVKYIYIKEGNKLPWDESHKYLQLNENDKLI